MGMVGVLWRGLTLPSMNESSLLSHVALSPLTLGMTSRLVCKNKKSESLSLFCYFCCLFFCLLPFLILLSCWNLLFFQIYIYIFLNMLFFLSICSFFHPIISSFFHNFVFLVRIFFFCFAHSILQFFCNRSYLTFTNFNRTRSAFCFQLCKILSLLWCFMLIEVSSKRHRLRWSHPIILLKLFHWFYVWSKSAKLLHKCCYKIQRLRQKCNWFVPMEK